MYIGCSAQSVPSLSKVAIRSATATKSGEPGLVTRSTKAIIAFFGFVSFHDGRGSPGVEVDGVDESEAIASVEGGFRSMLTPLRRLFENCRWRPAEPRRHHLQAQRLCASSAQTGIRASTSMP